MASLCVSWQVTLITARLERLTLRSIRSTIDSSRHLAGRLARVAARRSGALGCPTSGTSSRFGINHLLPLVRRRFGRPAARVCRARPTGRSRPVIIRENGHHDVSHAGRLHPSDIQAAGRVDLLRPVFLYRQEMQPENGGPVDVVGGGDRVDGVLARSDY
jgi:hypothetical protein